MKDHQLWIDTLNLNIQAGKALQEALLCADALSGWPFKYVNSEQTPDSVALERSVETTLQLKPLTAYESAMSAPDIEDSLF